jgi:hypothetical protein
MDKSFYRLTKLLPGSERPELHLAANSAVVFNRSKAPRLDGVADTLNLRVLTPFNVKMFHAWPLGAHSISLPLPRMGMMVLAVREI